MAYILGYFVADDCLGVSKERKNSYSFNITSADKSHLYKMRKAMGPTHKITNKTGKYIGNHFYAFQIRNPSICHDLIKLGITERKSYTLEPIKIPPKYFSDFARGFFDGDGTIFIYTVNGVSQIKGGFMSIRYNFIKDFNLTLCRSLKIPEKSLQTTRPSKKDSYLPQHRISLYISDCEKLFKFMYGHNPELYLTRKYNIFKK